MGQARVLVPGHGTLAMPNRIAMGATTWWDPNLVVLLALLAIAGQVLLGCRVYSRAILHTGSALRLGDAWRGSRTGATTVPARSGRQAQAVLVAAAIAAGALAVALSGDIIIATAVAAGTYAVDSRPFRSRRRAIR